MVATMLTNVLAASAVTGLQLARVHAPLHSQETILFPGEPSPPLHLTFVNILAPGCTVRVCHLLAWYMPPVPYTFKLCQLNIHTPTYINIPYIFTITHFSSYLSMIQTGKHANTQCQCFSRLLSSMI